MGLFSITPKVAEHVVDVLRSHAAHALDQAAGQVLDYAVLACGVVEGVTVCNYLLAVLSVHHFVTVDGKYRADGKVGKSTDAGCLASVDKLQHQYGVTGVVIAKYNARHRTFYRYFDFTHLSAPSKYLYSRVCVFVSILLPMSCLISRTCSRTRTKKIFFARGLSHLQSVCAPSVLRQLSIYQATLSTF